VRNLSVGEGAAAQTVPGFVANVSAGRAEPAQRLSFSVVLVETLDGPWAGDGLFASFSLPPATGTLAFAVAPYRFGLFRVHVGLRDDGGTANGGIGRRVGTSFTH
jgi:hypothetical protein